jgi:hypothetical protein
MWNVIIKFVAGDEDAKFTTGRSDILGELVNGLFKRFCASSFTSGVRDQSLNFSPGQEICCAESTLQAGRGRPNLRAARLQVALFRANLCWPSRSFRLQRSKAGKTRVGMLNHKKE